jgi:hypothetical protein
MAPGSTLNFAVDWSSWLNAGDSVSGTPTVTSGDADVTIVGSPSITGAAVSFKATLSATARLNKTLILARVTANTTQGLTDTRAIHVVVQVK